MEAIFPPTSLTPPETRKNKSRPPQKRGLEVLSITYNTTPSQASQASAKALTLDSAFQALSHFIVLEMPAAQACSSRAR